MAITSWARYFTGIDFNECIFKYLNKHPQDVQIPPYKYTDIFRRLLDIPQSQSMVCHKYLKLQVNESTVVHWRYSL